MKAQLFDTLQNHEKSISPDKVHSVLSSRMLADGFDIVLDLHKSEGLRIVDAKTGDSYLDFFSFFASSPVGINHPKINNDEFREKLGYAAMNKPSNSDMYTVEMAEFVERPRFGYRPIPSLARSGTD